MSVIENVVKFSIKKNLKKFLAGAGTTTVALAVPVIAKKTGVELNAEQQAQLAIFIGSLIVGGANAAKRFLPKKYASWIP